MKYKLYKRSCIICSSIKNRLLFRQKNEYLGAEYIVSECVNCGFINQNPAWKEECYNNLYTDHVYDPTNHKFYPYQVERYRSVASAIERLLLRQNIRRVLDFGCYDGSFIEWVKKFTYWGKNVDLVGYDIYLKNIPEKSFFYNSLKKLEDREGKFDLVIMNHVLEHIHNPLGTLRSIKNKLLKDNSHILIEVPDVSFLREGDISPAYYQHINYFTPHTISALGNKAGLSTKYLKSFKNFDIERDPNFPTLLIVFQKNSNYLADGESLVLASQMNQEALKKKLLKMKNGHNLGIIACGDYLHTISKIVKEMPNNIKIKALFDNNKNLFNKKIFGMKIQPVERVSEEKCDAYLIGTINKHNVEQILYQVSKYVPLKKIITIINI